MHIRVCAAAISECARLAESEAKSLARAQVATGERAGVAGNGVRYRVVIGPGDRSARRDVQRRWLEGVSRNAYAIP